MDEEEEESSKVTNGGGYTRESGCGPVTDSSDSPLAKRKSKRCRVIMDSDSEVDEEEEEEVERRVCEGGSAEGGRREGDVMETQQEENTGKHG